LFRQEFFIALNGCNLKRHQHKECNKVNLGLGATIRFQNYCLETDVEAFDQIPVFTTPQIVWMTWLK
jgi:hypothetical protein